MAKLTDHLDPNSLSQLQGAFSAAARRQVLLCSADGDPLLSHASPPADGVANGPWVEAPVSVNGEVVGLLRMQAGAHAQGQDSPQDLLKLMADMTGRLLDGERRLRGRTEELAALFSLTAEFTGQRDLAGVLDLVAKTVVRSMKAKACSIRLLSEDRTELVIKAVANMSSEYLNKGPILVSQSQIDQEIMSTGKPVYIADEQNDPRVLYPKEARNEGFVSAMCAPLLYKGKAEGVIKVYTAEPHVFDWFEIAMLQSIAAQAASAIVNARLHEEAVSTADMRRQVKTAAEVQRRLTPSQPPTVPGLDIGTLYVPCFELGGDFFDFLDLPPDNLGVAICDVAGKGIPASLLMASIRASLRAHALNIYDMSTVLDRVNRDLCADTLMGNFATLFYGVIDHRTRRFTYANAGHVPPILVRGGKCCSLTTGGGILGIGRTERWGHEHFTLQSGDVLLACTDGLTEAMNHADEPFGKARVESALLAGIAQGYNAAGVARHVLWEMRRFAGLQSKFDDLTLVVIKVL